MEYMEKRIGYKTLGCLIYTGLLFTAGESAAVYRAPDPFAAR